ncbi:hypothetical protein SCP_1101500 [Sparassis crispa]|uniref:Uncharacterized protein n=1 Tax=Sparassis crispa TaxID=139825 RepID=A0A401GZ87_9APHY|nr:hypothetical protein SCP_1101500 [Sparassis crispa]GBE87474.1 hypothetical protein SCP_1101500 [Sparassis crispa]
MDYSETGMGEQPTPISPGNNIHHYPCNKPGCSRWKIQQPQSALSSFAQHNYRLPSAASTDVDTTAPARRGDLTFGQV